MFSSDQGEDDFARWLLFSAFVQDFDSELSLKAELELKKWDKGSQGGNSIDVSRWF